MPFDAYQESFVDLRALLSEDPKQVVFVTGAGAGKWSGLPLWVELRGRLCDYAYRTLDEYPAEDRPVHELQIRNARGMQDLWNAFHVLKSALDRRFPAALTKHLTPQRESNPLYDALWNLNPKGIVSFNLDKLAQHSYSRVRGRSVDSATAMEPLRFSHFLSSTDTFLFLPHGTISDPSTWVMDTDAFERLVSTPFYLDFVKSLLISKTLVFVGFNASDVAFSLPRLLALGALGAAAPRHFVISETRDPDLLASYRAMNLNIVAYAPRLIDEHREVLEILEAISTFSPSEPVAPPVSALTKLANPQATLLDLQLIQRPLEEQRDILNTQLATDLHRHADSEDDQNKAIQSLIRRFPRSIQLAWMVDPSVPDASVLFGHTVLRDLDEGAFGRVFQVRNKAGTGAVKILKHENKTDLRYLTSFRRGIQSMRILRENHITGVVEIREAFDLPPCVFMEFIEGPTLESAVKEYHFRDLIDCLRILIRIGDIVSAGHRLPQRVLHRDLKPANVMFRTGDLRDHPEEHLVVLDFDLSWHEGSSGASVFHGARTQGYAAPEQIQTDRGSSTSSTRHTGVDVFGLGMLAFFILTARDPRAGEQNFDDFQRVVAASIRRLRGVPWSSLVDYLAYLVFQCTRDKQEERPGFDDVIKTLRRCELSIVKGQLEAGDPLVLEELAQIIGFDNVERQDFSRRLELKTAAVTLTISWAARTGGETLNAAIHRVQHEGDVRRGVERYLAAKADRAAKHLRGQGFTAVEIEELEGGRLLRAAASPKTLDRTELKRLGDGLKEARRILMEA